MNPAELFRQESNTVQLARGDFLFREGEKGDKMYVLLEGEIDIFLGDFVLETAGPVSLLGEMALIDESVRRANAGAKTPPSWPKSTGVGFIFSFSRHRILRRM
jgi:CRP-like cAMP-binding protein